MADNLTVLNSTGGTFTIRMTDVGAGILANNSIPTSTSGSPMSVQAGAAVVSTAQGAAVVVISSLSPSHLVTPSSAVQVTLTSATVTLSSNPTITSITSGTVAVGAGANTANVVAGSSAVTSTMSALVVALSTLGNAGLSVSTISSGSFAIINGANTAAVKPSGTAPSSTDMALVVSLSPNGINPNGQTTSSNSAPVVIASNQSAIPTTISSGTVTISSNVTISGNISLVPTTSGGLTISSVILASGTNSTLVSSSPRQLYKIACFNNSSNIGYLHLYNLSSAPTAGSSLVFDRILVPGNTSGAGTIWTSENGVPYGTGVGYTFTGGIADSDTTAVAASAFIVNIYYK